MNFEGYIAADLIPSKKNVLSRFNLQCHFPSNYCLHLHHVFFFILNMYDIMLYTLAFFRINRVGANAECHECAQTGMKDFRKLGKK